MFNKQIVDIYRNLYVQSGDGITSVSGGGTYVYGALATARSTEKTGYTFKSWNHTYGGGQASTSKNYSFKITDNTYLTANATGKTYYIHYDPGAAGGSATSMPASQSYTYSEGGTTSITTTKPSWKGHTFLGWSTDRNASSPSHAPGTTVAKKTSDLQLYALWKTNSYTMTNNFYKEKNGVWVRFGNSVDHTLLYGAYFKNTLDGFTGDTTGYHFWRFATDGWYVSDYNKNDSDGYGYFLPNEYTIRYDGNGATSGVMKSGAIAGNSHASSLKYDVSYRLTTNDFKRTGYHFLGWATSRDQANRKVVNYSDSSGIKNLTATHGATITLYAVWEPNKYTVKYHGNGATSGGVASQTCYYDTAYAYSQNTGPGFKNESQTSRSKFVGWGFDKTGTDAVYVPGKTFKNLASEDGAVVDLYAIWEKDNTDYTITVNPNGGTVTYLGTKYTSTFTFTGKYGTTFDLNVSDKTTNGTKWFNKWTLSNVDALSILDIPQLTMRGRIQGDGTVTATWTDLIKITVRPNGGRVNGHSEDFVIEGKAGDPFVLDFSFCDYPLKNVTFTTSGCATTKYAYVKSKTTPYDYDARTDVYTADANVFTPKGTETISYAAYNMNKSGTITVNWVIPDNIAVYKITLDDKGGTGGDGAIYEKFGVGYFADAKATVEINSVQNVPTKDGFTFLGYCTEPDGGTLVVDEKGKIVAANDLFTSDKTIYALWQENEVPETEYTVEHYLPNINPDTGTESYSSTPTDTDFYMGKEGNTVVTENLARTLDNYSAYAYSYAKNSAGTKITTAEIKKDMVIKIYYTGKYFKVTARKSTGIQDTTVSGKVTLTRDGETYYKTGTYVTVNATCLPDYSFATWTCTSGGLPASSNATYKFVMPLQDVVLTAYTSADPDIIYSIAYELNGGDDPLNPVLYTKKTDTFTLKNPVKANATFDGWSGTAITGKSKSVTIEKGSTGNREYTANWTWNTYKITLNNQNADTAGTKEYYEQYSVGNFADSSLKNKITKITIPTKQGYDFRGYFDKLTQTNNVDPKQYIDENGNITALSTDFTSNTILYAIWTPHVYTITLDNQGATTQGTQKTFFKYDDDFYQDITCFVPQEGKIVVPKKNTYDFMGYYTEKNGKGTRYIDETGVISSDFKATIKADKTLYAYWKNKEYTLTIELGEGIQDAKVEGYTATSKENGKIVYKIPHSASIKLVATEKTGYSFVSWKCAGNLLPESSNIVYATTMPAANIVVTAKASANKYTLVYDKNGGTGENIEQTIRYDEFLELRENPFTNESIIGRFTGWSLDANAKHPSYQEAEEIFASELINALGLENSPGSTITLYAVWDQAPTIIANDRYFTLDDAISGAITEEVMFQKATVTDREDGSIAPGTNTTPYGQTKFEMTGFDASVLPGLTENFDADVTFTATDTAGNVTTVTITLHIVSTATVLQQDYFYVRTMNLKYIVKDADEGGLEADSIWRQPEYYSVLYGAVNSMERDNKETKTVSFGPISVTGELDGTGTLRREPKEVWVFTQDDIDEVKEYVDAHGVGNAREADALANFYEQFKHCRTK